MNKLFLSLALLWIANSQLHAQQITTNVSRFKPDSTTIVKDSSGIHYPYAIWKKMLNSGNYILKAVDPQDANTTFVLGKMSAEQKALIASHAPKPIESKFFTTGTEFKFYKDKALDGYKVVPEQLAGKIVVFNFWFINCPPCRMEIPELNAIANQYKNDKDVVFIAAGLDQGYEVKDFIKNNPFGYHLLSDSRYLASKYGITAYPTHVIIDKQGKVRFHSSGYGLGTPHWIKKTIEGLKAE